MPYFDFSRLSESYREVGSKAFDTEEGRKFFETAYPMLSNAWEGWLLLSNFPDTPDSGLLIALQKRLGTISLGGTVLPNDTLEWGMVYSIEMNRTANRDENGLLIYSKTNQDFPCHTDDSCSDVATDLLMLLCVRPSHIGWNTYLIDARKVIAQLSLKNREILKRASFPFLCGLKPIITTDENWIYNIRYNRREIDRFSKILNAPLDIWQLDALDEMDQLISFPNCFYGKQLQCNECILINNTTMLHGRDGFEEDSDRLLKRIRLYRNF